MKHCCVDGKVAYPDPCPWGHSRPRLKRPALEPQLDAENVPPGAAPEAPSMFDDEPGMFGA